MKTLRLIGFGLFAVLLSFAFASCDPDDDGDDETTPETPVVTNPLVGTWVCDEGDWKHTVTFNSDGTGKNIYLEYYDGTVEKHEENFTYVYNESNSTVKIIFSGDGSETFDVKFISNNKMEYDGSIYVKI